MKNNIAKRIVKILNVALVNDENTNSSLLCYQPKAPKQIEKLRKNNDEKTNK